jgi:hypothetical protein
MKLLGRNIDGAKLLGEVRARLAARGIREDQPDAPLADEAAVDPHAYLVQALEENLDPAQPGPRTGAAGAVRSLVRLAARGVLEELFGRQRVFNTHVRDLAAILSAEVTTLRARVAELEGGSAAGKKRPARRPRTSSARRPGR